MRRISYTDVSYGQFCSNTLIFVALAIGVRQSRVAQKMALFLYALTFSKFFHC